MRVNLNCGHKPSLALNQSGLTLFKGDAKPAEVKSKPAQDTFEKSEKPAAPAQATTTAPATAPAAPAKTAAAPDAASKADAKCEGPNCKDCK